MSIDPYLVGPVGTEAMVVDVRMTLFADPGPVRQDNLCGGIQPPGGKR